MGSKLTLCLFLMTATLFSGCRDHHQNRPRIIDKVVFSVAPNLEYLSLSVRFSDMIQSDLQGSFPIMNYGSLFASASTQTTPFEVGFRLNSAVFDEQNFLNITPISVLPNGMNMPVAVDRALVEVSAQDPLTPRFQMFGYVDIIGRQWMGNSMVVNNLENVFPANSVFTQNLFPDENGLPGAVAVVFGSKVENGQVQKAGGMAIFGNLSRLGRAQSTQSNLKTLADGSYYIDISNEVNDMLLKQYIRARSSQAVPHPSENDLPIR